MPVIYVSHSHILWRCPMSYLSSQPPEITDEKLVTITSLGRQRLGTRKAFCRRARPPDGLYRTRRGAPDRVPARQSDFLVPMAKRSASCRGIRPPTDCP